MGYPEPDWPAAAVAGWRALLRRPEEAVLALDFDGTLAPIVADPASSRPVEGTVEVLSRLVGRVVTLAVVTGRAASTVVELGGLDAVPGLLVLGHYGLERWQDGVLTAPPVPPGVDAVRTALPGLLAGAPDGVGVEDKRASLVVHTRPAADPDEALAALLPALTELAQAHGLELVAGRMVAELRPPGVDKGTAVRDLVAGTDAPLLVAGDDLGDLPAFAVVHERRGHGYDGLALGSDGGPGQQAADPVKDAVDVLLAGPHEVVEVLTALAEALT